MLFFGVYCISIAWKHFIPLFASLVTVNLGINLSTFLHFTKDSQIVKSSSSLIDLLHIHCKYSIFNYTWLYVGNKYQHRTWTIFRINLFLQLDTTNIINKLFCTITLGGVVPTLLLEFDFFPYFWFHWTIENKSQIIPSVYWSCLTKRDIDEKSILEIFQFLHSDTNRVRCLKMYHVYNYFVACLFEAMWSMTEQIV